MGPNGPKRVEAAANAEAAGAIVRALGAWIDSVDPFPEATCARIVAQTASLVTRIPRRAIDAHTKGTHAHKNAPADHGHATHDTD
jgi:hypothetical protein